MSAGGVLATAAKVTAAAVGVAAAGTCLMMVCLPAPIVKRVFFVRHGHAQHNDAFEKGVRSGLSFGDAALKSGEIRDPALTPKGEGQARSVANDPVLQPALKSGPERAEAVVVSPCRRTLETAVIGLSGVAPALPFVAQPDCQECADLPSDTGRPVSALRNEFPMVDFSQITNPDSWFKKVGPWDFATGSPKPEGQAALAARCVRFTSWLLHRPEGCLIVVAHHTFLAFLLELEFSNCEVMELALHADGSWSVLSARDDVKPLKNKDGTPMTICGCKPLSGTAAKPLY